MKYLLILLSLTACGEFLSSPIIPGTIPMGAVDIPCPTPTPYMHTESGVNELSGLITVPGIGLIGHGDSGQDPLLIEVESGRQWEVIGIPAETHIDWEDIAIREDGSILICDTGDNYYGREHARVLLVPPLDPGKTTAGPVSVLDVYYPDGAQDVEACFASEEYLWLITKHVFSLCINCGDEGEAAATAQMRSKIYRVVLDRQPFELAQPMAELAISQEGEDPFRAMITGADISRDWVGLMSYRGPILWARGESVFRAFHGARCDLAKGAELQAEAFAFTPRGFVTGGEVGGITWWEW